MPARGNGLILRGAQLNDQVGLSDLAFVNGVFVPVEEHLDLPELDLQGRLVIPGFVDVHMHLDKAFALESGLDPGDSLLAAIQNFYRWRDSISPQQIYRNARRAAEQALSNGTLALRTHTTVDQSVGLSWLEPLLRVKEELAPWMTIQLVAFPDSMELIERRSEDLLKQALAAGADAIGGAPLMCSAPQEAIDILFDLAGEAGCDLDLHIDESDSPSANTLEILAERKIALGFPGRVVAGHCTSLSALPEADARRVIEKVAQAGLFIVTLPSCNLFLMGRQDRGLVRRGLTRVRELLAAGVSVSFASDNIRDAFNPFGNADMLQQALICAQALQMGSNEELVQILKMGTEYPAKAMGLEEHNLRLGDPASFVVLDAQNWGSALARVAPRRYVYTRGVCAAENSLETHLFARP
jgi:cytosine deaminase